MEAAEKLGKVGNRKEGGEAREGGRAGRCGKVR